MNTVTRASRPHIGRSRFLPALLLLLLTCALPARAQSSPQKPSSLADVTITQNLGQQLPPDITLTDSDGKKVTIAQLKTNRPVVLTLVYFGCPSLCTVILNESLSTLSTMPMTLGKDYDVWTISFDPRETADLARAKKPQYVHTYNHTKGFPLDAPLTSDNWHFLTADQANITRLTNAVGFHYKWDEESQQFFHPAGITILSPDATISRYFFGVHYEMTDVRLALLDAGHGKVGSFTDQLLLYCYHYDPSTGRYTLSILHILETLAAVTILTLAAALAYLFHVDKKRTRDLMPTTSQSPPSATAGPVASHSAYLRPSPGGPRE